jgi:hypothetical protein
LIGLGLRPMSRLFVRPPRDSVNNIMAWHGFESERHGPGSTPTSEAGQTELTSANATTTICSERDTSRPPAAD